MSTPPLPPAAWFAEHVMGWRPMDADEQASCTYPAFDVLDDTLYVWKLTRRGFIEVCVWNPLTSDADALQLVYRVRDLGWFVSLMVHPEGDASSAIYQRGYENIVGTQSAETLAHAICRAVEAWARAQEEAAHDPL